MKVLILANGKGERLMPITETTQKVMVPIAGKPCLKWIIEHLSASGFKDFVLAVGIMKEQIMDYFGNGEKFGINIEYSINNKPQGTAGELARARKFLENEENFVLYYGDTLTNLDLRKMLDLHKNSQAIITTPGMKEIFSESGIYVCENGRIKDFHEKPFINDLVDLPLYSNVPVYIINKKIWENSEIKEGNDFNADVFPSFVDNREVKIYFQDGLWHLDIGDLKKYNLACDAYETNSQAKLRKLA